MFGNKGPFPQKHQTKHSPTGEKPHFIKKSEHVESGHQDSMNRMTPLGNDDFPNDPAGTGEGIDNQPAPSGIPHPFNE